MSSVTKFFLNQCAGESKKERGFREPHDDLAQRAASPDPFFATAARRALTSRYGVLRWRALGTSAGNLGARVADATRGRRRGGAGAAGISV